MSAESQTCQLVGITYRDRLPVDWEVLSESELPSDGEQHRLNRANEELLQNLLLLDEAPQDTEEMEEGSGQEHFKRLEAKLDLLLNLVTEMMNVNGGGLPEPRALNFGARGVCVHTQGGDLVGLHEGSLLKIRLYLDPQFPRPLDLCGHITALQADNFTVSYAHLEEPLQALLDKYIFRQHRRAVALARRRESP